LFLGVLLFRTVHIDTLLPGILRVKSGLDFSAQLNAEETLAAEAEGELSIGLVRFVLACLVLAWLGRVWFGLASRGLARLGLAWLGLGWAVLRIRDVYPGSRIPDPKTATKVRGEKNLMSYLLM
jgi:hypothetical protein